MTTEIRNEPAETYHSHITSVSRSMLWTLRKSPREFDVRFNQRKTSEEPDSLAMEIGTIAHAVVLEGKSIDDCVVRIPDEVLQLYKGKPTTRKGDAWDAFKAANPGKVLLRKDEIDDTEAMTRAVLAHREISKWHSDPRILREQAIYWTCEETGLALRCRPDWMIVARDRVIVPDFKTTTDTRPHKFSAVAREHGYHLQQAFYSDGVEKHFGLPVSWVFIVAKRTPGYTVATFQFGERTQERAREQYRFLKTDLVRRIEENDWADPEEAMDNLIELPDYEFQNQEETANV